MDKASYVKRMAIARDAIRNAIHGRTPDAADRLAMARHRDPDMQALLEMEAIAEILQVQAGGDAAVVAAEETDDDAQDGETKTRTTTRGRTATKKA